MAFSTAAASLAEMGLVPAGVFAWSPLAEDTQLRYVDLSRTVTVGEVWGEINVEALAALRPDVIVTIYDPTDESLYGVTDDQRPQLEAIAPLIGIDNTAPLLTQFDRFQALGVALGADPAQASLLDARQRFNELSQRVEAAASAEPGLRVMAVSASDTGMNVAQPEPNPDLAYYGSLGVEFVVPDGEGIFWWEELAPENLAKYDADVIIVDQRAGDGDQRAGDGDRRALEQQPLWPTLPAVQAGQVYGWHAFDPPTYRFSIDALTDLAAAIEASRIVS